MYRKKNPRTEFLIVRLTKQEKSLLKEEAVEYNRDFSDHIRYMLGFSDKGK